ncbi:MAG: GNAT family N-acetyltransferase [Nanoarchaeota archaeon]
MIIRNATLNDAKFIRKISIDSTIKRDSKEKTGFLEFNTLSEKEYSKRIKLTPFFYVAEDNNDIIGFLSAFPNKLLNLIKSNEPEVFEYMVKQKGSFIYGDQIAVKKEYYGKGIAKLLYTGLKKDARKESFSSILGIICHKPIKNENSIKFNKKIGFKLIDELKIKDLVFGVYKLTLST